MTRKKSTIARIENILVFDSKYQLTAKEQKVILLLISKIDPTKKGLTAQTLSIGELEQIIEGNSKSGSFKKELNKFASRLLKRQLSFRTNLVFKGESLEGHINWFQSIIPVETEAGQLAIRFKFSEDLTPFLINLREYVQIDYTEVLPISSGHAIRMFQIFKAYRSRMSKHQKKSKIEYEIPHLKQLLGISGKYNDFRNFKRRVIDRITIHPLNLFPQQVSI